MASNETRSTKELFRAWRSGDAEAGQLMAQRFADWYYAIATSRLGEQKGRGPCETACTRFGEGIVQVTESRALVGWAHEIIARELEPLGGRVTDGNEPNPYTANQPPKKLLARAKAALPDEVALLEACYSKEAADAELEQMAAPLGGMPLGILEARYRVKRWLRDNARVPFEVVPDSPNLDRAPLPLYESGRMATAAEETNFEHWMLTDLDLCKDIAEFAHFAIALRGGIGEAEGAPLRRQDPIADEGEVAPGGSAAGRFALGGGLLLAAIGMGVLLFLAILLTVMFFV